MDVGALKAQWHHSTLAGRWSRGFAWAGSKGTGCDSVGVDYRDNKDPERKVPRSSDWEDVDISQRYWSLEDG